MALDQDFETQVTGSRPEFQVNMDVTPTGAYVSEDAVLRSLACSASKHAPQANNAISQAWPPTIIYKVDGSVDTEDAATRYYTGLNRLCRCEFDYPMLVFRDIRCFVLQRYHTLPEKACDRICHLLFKELAVAKQQASYPVWDPVWNPVWNAYAVESWTAAYDMYDVKAAMKLRRLFNIIEAELSMIR